MSSRFDFEAYDEQPFYFEDEEEVGRSRRSAKARKPSFRGRAGSGKGRIGGVRVGGKLKKRPRPVIKFPGFGRGGSPPIAVFPGVFVEPGKEPTRQPPVQTPATTGMPSPPPENDSPSEGSEFIRWVQNTLNQTMGLNLPVDGVMGVETRSAIRSFQSRQSLPVDGIVGPRTEAALIAVSDKNFSQATGSASEFEFEWETIGDRETREMPFEFESGHCSQCGFPREEFESEYEATPCQHFIPVAVESPGGKRIKNKRIPASSEIVFIQGAFAKTPLHSLAAEALNALVCAARANGIKHPQLLPTGSLSGFRTPKQQANLRSSSAARHGSQDIGKWVAKPGSSAHQTGRAIDFYLGMRNSRQNVTRLRQTQAYKWMVANAHRFGFYPYPAEPWHWEYNPPAVESELYETKSASVQKASFRYVKDFSGPTAECAAALKQAGKTKAEALKIINNQISVAIKLLNKAADDLKRGSRSTKTKNLFQKIFRVKPEFVPIWLKPTATIKDRGDVVATRCRRVADLLASGKIKFFCTVNTTNCPDCGNDASGYACSSWGDESKAPKNSLVICLGDAFWEDMKAGRTKSMLSTLMHEPFHIYFGQNVTEHRKNAGKFGGINCIVEFVFEINARTAPSRVNERCRDMAVRKEINPFLSI